jgi:RNA polymerase sigma factor (TIGR02999 family)
VAQDHVEDPAPQDERGPRPEGLIEAMYTELRQLARRHLGGERGHTLQPTALLNEAFVKLARYGGGALHDRAHFAALVSRVMRQILVDHARSKQAARHRGDRSRVSISDVPGDDANTSFEVLALDAALQELGELSPTKAQLVERRFFGGMTETEAADSLGMSRAEATRQWRMTRAWLAQRLRGDPPP